jgi:hypothetical protein
MLTGLELPADLVHRPLGLMKIALTDAVGGGLRGD